MTMTDERLAELDALLAKAKAGEWERDVFFIRAKDEAHASDIAQCFKGHRDSFNCATANAAAIVALHNAYPDLRATIDAQAAMIARLDEALREIVSLVVEAIDLERIGAVVALDAIADVAHAAIKGAA